MPNPTQNNPASAQQPSLAAINQQYRAAVVRQAIKIVQPLQSLSVNPANQAVVNFTPRNVGLIIGFLVQVSVQMLNASGTSSLTTFGPANLLSNITFNDFDNYQRISAPGWYVHMINSVKNRQPYGSCLSFTNFPVAFGNNFTGTIKAPATLSTSGQTVAMVYHVPIAYSDWDLRGSMYAAITGVQANLALTINQTPWVASGDATLAVYSGGTGGAYTGNMTLDVYQVFYDQLPQVKTNQGNQVAVPPLDVATTYELHQTSTSGMVAAQENTIPFSNYRQFLSTTAVYDNGGTLNTGSDVNYWALQAANLLYIFRKEPWVSAIDARKEIGCDMPAGTYYFSTRDKPIDTQVYGNLNLVLNPISVNANAAVYVGYETFARRNVVLQAQALPAA